MQIVVEAEIRGRKAYSPPASVAGGDPSVDLPEPAEERRRLPRLAGFQQLADMGRGIDGRILTANRLDDGDVEAMLPTSRAQQIRRPTAAVAKGAVPADDDMRGADRSNDDLGDEVVGAFSRKAEIEMLDKQQVDAEAERLGRGKEHAARMRLEGQHSCRHGLRMREVARSADQHRVAAMQAVEIAHRKDRPGRVIRPGAGMSDDSDHGSGAQCSCIVSQFAAKIARPRAGG